MTDELAENRVDEEAQAADEIKQTIKQKEFLIHLASKCLTMSILHQKSVVFSQRTTLLSRLDRCLPVILASLYFTSWIAATWILIKIIATPTRDDIDLARRHGLAKGNFLRLAHNLVRASDRNNADKNRQLISQTLHAYEQCADEAPEIPPAVIRDWID